MEHHRGNFFLVGLMGAGKTTLGKPLAQSLGKTFLDADDELEKREARSIPEIFAQNGEVFFREREEKLLREFVRSENIVLATGGGVVLREANRTLLMENGTVVYLRATPEILTQRLRHRQKNRPLLHDVDDMLERLQTLYRERDSLYQQTAHIVFEEQSDETLTSALATIQALLTR
jgi:Shikimate kinase